MNRRICVLIISMFFPGILFSNDIFHQINPIILDNEEAKIITENFINFDSPIEIISAYQVDLFSDELFTEICVVFSQYNGESIGYAIFSYRQNRTEHVNSLKYIEFPMRQITFEDEIIDLTISSLREAYDFYFFEYNDSRYIIVYNEWINAPFFSFDIFIFHPNDAPNFSIVERVFSEYTTEGNVFEIYNNRIEFHNNLIIIHMNGDIFILTVQDELFSLISYDN